MQFKRLDKGRDLPELAQGPGGSEGDPLVLVLLEHLKDGEEQIEDVKVKLNRRPDVLVISVALDQVLGVVDDEA